MNVMPPETSISTTDLIAVGALLVAILSAIYARGARDEANRPNEISTREPDVEAKTKELVLGAWKMQRLVDRIAGGQTTPQDRQYEAAEDNVHGSVEWFANENGQLKALFQPYLSAD